jgi:hypothetical protein
MRNRHGILADLAAEAARRTTYKRQMHNVIDTRAATTRWKRGRLAELDALIERSDIIIDALLDDLWATSEHVQNETQGAA